MDRRKIVITCEHAGNYVPKDYVLLFTGNETVLDSHEGLDPGAFRVAKFLAKQLKAPLHYQKITRLLVEVNRSVGHKQLFSRFSDKLDHYVKNRLLEKYYYAYRNDVESRIAGIIEEGEAVLHMSIHSFVPVLNGVERRVDLGILFDENRSEELDFAINWKEQLNTLLPELAILPNVPYHGADDGLTTYLRTKFSSDKYLGIEVEVNQKYVDAPAMKAIEGALLSSLQKSQGKVSQIVS